MNNAANGPADFRAEPWWWHPWPWMLLALGSTGLAFVWARCLPPGQTPLEIVQLPLLVVGSVAAGLAIWRRCATPEVPAYLDALSPRGRRNTLLVLAGLHGLIALAVSAVLALRLGGMVLPGNVAGDFLLWLMTAPWCGWTAWRLYHCAGDGQSLSSRLETAVLVSLGGMVALLAAWALFWGPDLADAWDSMRLFFLVLAAVAFLAAPVVAAAPWVRRLVVSGLIVLHLAGIVSAVVGASPGPFLVAQAQHWIFRPYLDFMYLNNAYRFYSPEPNPASQLWFRIEYVNGDMLESRWIKLPETDEDGTPRVFSSVQFTRRLALTEMVSHSEPMPRMGEFTPDGQLKPAEFVERRDMQSLMPANKDKVGVKQPAKWLAIPYHPDLQSGQNYMKPDPTGRQLLSSYARYVLRQPHPEHRNAKPVRVKIYRVLHRTLSAEQMYRGEDPQDPIHYLPYYEGQFDTEGRLLDPDDPLLYWALPILRTPDGVTRFYIYRHSGDEGQFLRQPKTMMHPLDKR